MAQGERKIAARFIRRRGEGSNGSRRGIMSHCPKIAHRRPASGADIRNRAPSRTRRPPVAEPSLMLVHSVDPDGCRGIEVERLPAGEVAICIFHCCGGDDALPRDGPVKPLTALVCQYFSGRPAFAGMIVNDTVSAPDAWSLTLDHSNRVAHNGAQVLPHVGITPFPRLHTAEFSLFGPETAYRC
jgi:hypothetical protein